MDANGRQNSVRLGGKQGQREKKGCFDGLDFAVEAGFREITGSAGGWVYLMRGQKKKDT
jgi:hypothetical protein